jgi:hypothetical protein
MPRPPILPTLDWKQVFDSGRDYGDWLAGAESPEQARRMESALRSIALTPQDETFLAALPRPVRVVAIAEDWCGDVVRHVPVLQRLAESAPALAVSYLSRSDSPEVFGRFLTNGGEAIPKFIFLSEAWVECGNWGPMPEACRRLIARGKACGDVAAARKLVSSAYAADPGCAEVVRELIELLDTASCRRP